MSYRSIKWMILYLPSIAIGIWEYVRHQFLLPYISMELGNFLTPILAYLVGVTLLTRLFSVLEAMQEQLNRERAAKIALEAREHLARELHDGIAQSLFLLAVKLDAVQSKNRDADLASDLIDTRKTVHEVNRYVRQAIADLKVMPEAETQARTETLERKLLDMIDDIGVEARVSWGLSEASLTTKEQVELLACLREAFLNIKKHAQATEVEVESMGDACGWICKVRDNGCGLREDPFQMKDRFGLRILQERAEEMNWRFALASGQGKTVIELRKERQTGELSR